MTLLTPKKNSCGLCHKINLFLVLKGDHAYPFFAMSCLQKSAQGRNASMLKVTLLSKEALTCVSAASTTFLKYGVEKT